MTVVFLIENVPYDLASAVKDAIYEASKMYAVKAEVLIRIGESPGTVVVYYHAPKDSQLTMVEDVIRKVAEKREEAVEFRPYIP